MFISYSPLIYKWCISKACYTAIHVHRTMWNVDKTFIIMKYEATYHSTMAGSNDVTHDNLNCGKRWIMQNQTDEKWKTLFVYLQLKWYMYWIYKCLKTNLTNTQLKKAGFGPLFKRIKIFWNTNLSFPFRLCMEIMPHAFFCADVKIQV